jgi:Putative peptidoglycan binding domain/LysM domain
MPEYTVKQGNCISSIAQKHGLFWEKVWNHPKNAELKESRKDPNILYPGDVVFVPDKEEKEETGATEQRHRFRKKGVPALLRLIVEIEGEIIANAPYVLEVDGKLYSGETDEDGMLEVGIEPNAKKGHLTVGELDYELELGGMDPLNEHVGIQTRLQNLGFYEGDLDGKVNPETKEALILFQRSTGIEATGEMDQTTRDKLFSWQDEIHVKQTIEDEGEDDVEQGPEDDENAEGKEAFDPESDETDKQNTEQNTFWLDKT